MRVILMDDVERVGHEGDILDVADGYARNYLIPRKLAVQATRGALKDLEQRRKAIEAREVEKRARAEEVARELSGKRITVKARAGTGERLHGQVTPQMIAEAATAQLGMTIDRRDIDIPEPIRTLGDFLVSAKIYKGVSAQLPVSVVRDTESEEAEEEEAPEEAAEEEESVLEESEAEYLEESEEEEEAEEE